MMIALAFLGMAASVLVGFLASRVGASAGRDLRGRVFHKVVGFSNHEFNQFSTASLITRSTNDIQQIQMLIVMLLRMVLYAPILAIGGVLPGNEDKCVDVLDHRTCGDHHCMHGIITLCCGNAEI